MYRGVSNRPASGTTVDYGDVYPCLEDFNNDLYKIISFIDDEMEFIPHDDETAVGIFSQQQLTKLTKIVRQDRDNLSNLDNILYSIYHKEEYEFIDNYGYSVSTRKETHDCFEYTELLPKPLEPKDLEPGSFAIVEPEYRLELMEFYNKFSSLLELANSQPHYKIINEIHYV
jgi:hypothetical protein